VIAPLPFQEGSSSSAEPRTVTSCVTFLSAALISCPSTFGTQPRMREMVDQGCRHLWLPEREHVRLGAALEERDLQGPFADRVVLAYELVQAAVPEQAVPIFVDVDAV